MDQISMTDFKRVLELRLSLNLRNLADQAAFVAEKAGELANDANAKNVNRIGDGLLTASVQRIDSLCAQIAVIRDALSTINGEGR